MRRKAPPVYPRISIPTNKIVNEETLRKLNIRTLCLKDSSENLAEDRKPVNLDKRRKKAARTSLDQAQSSSTPLDTVNDDSSDENSSKSTLDWIIPPLSNFHGRNNPFHSQYKSNAGKMTKKGKASVFEKAPEIRIVRTIKRRLSAKDLAMGSNRDAKRRKILKRLKSSDVEIISEIIQPVSMPLPTYFPVRACESKDSIRALNVASEMDKDKDSELSFTNGQTSKLLRSQRQSRVKAEPGSFSQDQENQAENQNSANMSVINSPVKNKSINLYFGAFNRIENGENFSILAKRLTFDGKEQYLLEWDTPSAASIKSELQL